MNDNPRPTPNAAYQLLPIGFFLLIFVATLATKQIFRWSLGKSVVAVLAAMSAFYLVLHVLFIAVWLRAKSSAGRLLLDCGKNPLKRTYLLLAASWGLVAVLSTVAIVVAALLGKKDLQTYIVVALGFATVPSFCLIMGFSRLQFRENGIWWYIRLLQWERIEFYDWQGGEEPTLMIKFRGGFSFARQGTLSIPLEQADAVDELLRTSVRIEP